LTVSCLLGNAEYPARGIAKRDLLGVSVPQALFIQLVEQSPTFRTFIFHFFGERLSRLMALIEEVAFRKLDQRLAALLLNNGGVLEATHQKLADELGSVREVISRILADFQGQGMVQLERGQIRVLDKAGLERMASTM
jgi:CRP/FNR family transcriptional regulator